MQPGDTVITIRPGTPGSWDTIAEVGGQPYWKKFTTEDEANARLIVAAPDLLATVRCIRDAIANCGDQPICAWAGALNAVIAKAEGGSQR